MTNKKVRNKLRYCPELERFVKYKENQEIYENPWNVLDDQGYAKVIDFENGVEEVRL